MSNHRNDLLELHYASVVGSLLGARPAQGPAPRDAEPETYTPRRGALRRLAAAVRARRETAARPETDPA
jgi:hypothetical protein